MLLSYVRKPRLVAVCFLLTTGLLLLLRRSPGIVPAGVPARLRHGQHNNYLTHPQRRPGDPPFLHDPPPLVPPRPHTGLNADDTLPPLPPRPGHPIGELIAEARFNFSQLLGKQPLTLAQAAAQYRESRGRHPPPGFDRWFEAAQADRALVIESFFDRIYDDLAPFWAIEPKELQWQTRHQPQYIRIRAGRVDFVTDDPNRPPFIQRWTELVAEMMPHIPDLNMVVNVMDETRILVPFGTVAGLVAAERRDRRMIHPSQAVSSYSPFDDGDGGEVPFEPRWIRDRASQYWDHLSAACPPGSPGRDVPALGSFADGVEYPAGPSPLYTHRGYVRNVSMARDPCLQPHLRGMHGTFAESISMATLTTPFPIFGGYKLAQNNDIVIPAAMYLDEDNKRYHGSRWSSGPSWDKKKAAAVWRGAASGGRNKENNWAHFQRHRFVQMLNGSAVSALERGDGGGVGQDVAAPTFRLVDPDVYGLAAQREGRLGQWISRVADVAFVHLECFPAAPFVRRNFLGRERRGTEPTCSYTDPWFAVREPMSMSAMYAHKIIPDMDGNSYSARFRAFLRSTSMPLKATIYAEWHDGRLVPWVHYVPLDMSYMDIYGVLDYFLNTGETGDADARRIADDGRAWAEAAYRREDMKLYVWRLLLEYGRVVDERRDRLAFVADLKWV